MLKNYFKIAVRNLTRHRLYTLINISGLALGMGGSLLIFAYVLNELSYENFHCNRKQIYRVAVEFGRGENSMLLAGAMPALGPALEKEEPEVLKAVRFQRHAEAVLEYGDREFRESRFFFADPQAFDVFTFPLVAGDPQTALTAPFQLVLSETMAQKYFGDQLAVGKVLKYMGQYEFQVTGVMQDIPANTHLKCDFLASYSSLERIAKVEHPWNQFGRDYTYLLLQKGTDIAELREKIFSVLGEHTNPAFAAMLSFRLQPIEEIHLHSKMMGELDPPGNLGYVYLFSSIAGLVLLIACLNYMNLSTARSFHRIKEIGVRKVLGAARVQLARQLLSESILVTAVAMGFSLLIFEIFFPSLARFLETELVMDLFRTSRFYLLLAGIMVFVGVVAGLYPALFLSRRQPIESLKITLRPDSASAAFRKILVISQFAISIFLLAGTLVIERQLHFMKETDLGFEKHNVVLIPFQAGDEQVSQKYPALRQEFARTPHVVSVSGAYTVPGLHNKEQQSVRLKGAPPEEMVMMRAIGVDYDYVHALGLRIVQGRNFSRDFSDDARHAILLNESAVKHLGLDDPIGSELLLPSGKLGEPRTVRVVGVVKDFHVESLRESIEPVFLYINPERYYTIAVRIEPVDVAGTVQSLKSAWHALLPGQSFQYTFLSDTYDALYVSEEKTGEMAGLFSVLAVYIACMGLFGLAAFTAERRTKEIGIRKVLGATVANVVSLLSKDFVKLVLIANLIAWPVAWWAMNRWLENFAYRIDIGWWVFVLAGGLALVIALVTVSTQAIKAALANPVDSLRYE